MRKLILSSGHTNVPGKDRGASSGEWIEGDLAAEFVELLAKNCEEEGIEVFVDDFKNPLAKTLEVLKPIIKPTDLAIEIHWNAAGPTATGTETLIPGYPKLRTPSEFEKKAASKISETISRVLRIRNRGVKTESESARGKLGWMGLACETLLVEVCFITNTNDMLAYETHKEQLAIEVIKDTKELLNS